MSARGMIVTATPVKQGPRLILLLLFALCALWMHSNVGAYVLLPFTDGGGVMCGSSAPGLFCRPAPHSLTQICLPTN